MSFAVFKSAGLLDFERDELLHCVQRTAVSDQNLRLLTLCTVMLLLVAIWECPGLVSKCNLIERCLYRILDAHNLPSD